MKLLSGGTHQSAPLSIVSEQAAPREAKSADKMEGAMIAGGPMAIDGFLRSCERRCLLSIES